MRGKAVYAGVLTRYQRPFVDDRQGVKLFDELIVAIGEKPPTSVIPSVRRAPDMLRGQPVICRICRVSRLPIRFWSVTQNRSAPITFCVACEPPVIMGERTIRYINGDLFGDIETVFLMPPREIAEVSSTMVKGFGWRTAGLDVVHKYVPKPCIGACCSRRLKWLTFCILNPQIAQNFRHWSKSGRGAMK